MSPRNEIYPEEILLDAENLPNFDVHQFEGRIERPISRWAFVLFFFLVGIVSVIYLGQVFLLQIVNGNEYASLSETNRLRHIPIFAERGIIYDRNEEIIAGNDSSTSTDSFVKRVYTQRDGLGHLLGYLSYPKKDSSGFYYQTDFEAKEGIEKAYDEELKGKHGIKLIETDALENIVAENSIEPPEHGTSLSLSIDADMSERLYKAIRNLAEETGFHTGAGIIMKIDTGEILAITDYPEYKSSILSDGKDVETIQGYLKNKDNVFLNRSIDGLFTPGSVVKPFVAIGALEENVIGPNDIIVSNGYIEVENPYDPDRPTVFNDWKAHGPVNIKDALAVSSNVFFYVVGGGYKDIEGLGIDRINKYLRAFGLGEQSGKGFLQNPSGTVPSPEWKKKVFPNDPWRIGDTYYTAIGQYGFQIAPIQMLKAVTAIATEGYIVEPTIEKTDTSAKRIKIPIEVSDGTYAIVKEGMRKSVTDGTARALSMGDIVFAGKTGTAELGTSKKEVNSWVMGFFPYENPKYSFVMVMEKGPRSNLVGAPVGFRRFLDDLFLNRGNPFDLS